jgi:hypothetical protein
MKEKVTSSKKNTVITLSDEVTELSSIKCTVDNWKVILDTCVNNKEIWDKYSIYSSRFSFIYINFDDFEDFYTSG